MAFFAGNPDRALVLIALGLLFIYWEFLRPGRVFPGTLGGIAVAVGLTAMAEYGFESTGAMIILVGLVLVAVPFRGMWMWAAGLLSFTLLAYGLHRMLARPGVHWFAATMCSLVLTGLIPLRAVAMRARRNKFSEPASSECEGRPK